MKRILSIITALLVIVSLSACGKKIEEAEEAATNVTVFKAQSSDISNTITYTGELKAKEESYVSPKSAGIIRELMYDIGEYVYAGDVLAVLDDTDYRIAYNQALAAYNNAVASYNSVTNGTLKQNQNQLSTALSSAEIEYNSAMDNYSRQKALYDAGAISKVAFESAETRLKSAELNYNSTKNNYDITINEINKDSEASAKAGVESAKAALQAATNNLNNTTIFAPMSGYIASRNAVLGQMATQGSPIFVIKSTDLINAEISVTESVIPYITKNSEAIVSVSSAGLDGIKGTITDVSTIKSDNTGMYTVRVEINNKDNLLKIGMFADIEICTESKNDVIVVPSQSLIQDEDGYYLYVANDDRATRKDVKIGIRNNEYTEITEGLDLNENVIVSGKEYISEKNNKIRIVED